MRLAGQHVLIATMMPADRGAPGWEHAVVYAIDAQSGREVARRVLPDPVPVAAMVIEGSTLHVVATRKGEAVYWYGLSTGDLAARHRRVVSVSGPRHDDVLDAWATPEGALWLELDAIVDSEVPAQAGGPPEGHTRPDGHLVGHAFADVDGELAEPLYDPTALEVPPHGSGACARGADLYATVPGRWSP